MRMNPKRATNLLTAIALLVGIIAVIIFGRKIIGADVILPGYATAHLHFEITVCEKSIVPIKAVFTPPVGKRYYFKERSFEIAAGLNTIEWYIRKIPGGSYTAMVTSNSGFFNPDQIEAALVNNKVTDAGKYSLVICQPQIPAPSPTPDQDEPGEVPQASPTPSVLPAQTGSPSTGETLPSVPAVPIPHVPSGNDDLSLPV